jgi:hypothetical protein
VNKILLLLATALGPSLLAQDVISPDLAAIASARGWKGDVAGVTVSSKDGSPAIEFNPPQDQAQIIWLDGFSFTNGVIEFDVRGRSAPPQSSFVGVAFRVADAKTYDAVYFRPFNYRAADPVNRAHAVQYISLPAFPWRRLRTEKPGQYEKGIEPAPDGDAWLHARIVIARPKIRVFVNGAAEPSLVVDELSDRTGGSVGLWCTNFGMLANLRITPKK